MNRMHHRVIYFLRAGPFSPAALRTLVAFALAPLAAAIVFPAGSLIFVLFVPLLLHISYVTAFVLGVPVYVVLRRFAPTPWAFVLAGAALAYAGFIAYMIVGVPLTNGRAWFDLGWRGWQAFLPLDREAPIFLLVLGSGALAGFSLWRIARPDKTLPPPRKVVLGALAAWAVALVLAVFVVHEIFIAGSQTTICERALVSNEKLKGAEGYRRLEASGSTPGQPVEVIHIRFRTNGSDDSSERHSATCYFQKDADGSIRHPYAVERITFFW